MILSGDEIKKNVKSGKIIISPYDESNITTNSYDFCLGSKIKVYDSEVIDPKKQLTFKTINIPDEGMILEPNIIYLGNTLEVIGSDHFVPIIRGRSSTGRLGLFVHVTADLLDIGFVGQCTLMLHAVQRLKVYPGMKIGQVTFWVPKGKIDLYNGKYQMLDGPQTSQIYKDFQ